MLCGGVSLEHLPQKHQGPQDDSTSIVDGLQCKAPSATSPLPRLLLLGNPLSDALSFLPTALPNLPFLSWLCLCSLYR